MASLDRAAEAGDRGVGFAALSCGAYGYPLDQAAQEANSAVRQWLSTHPDSGITDIIWVLRGADVMAAFRGAFHTDHSSTT